MPVQWKRKTRTEYAIDLEGGPKSLQGFIAFLKADNQRNLDGKNTLCADLEKIPGVSNVEYDGYFGEAIYFRIDKEDDCNRTWTAITSTIKKHVNPHYE